MSSISIQCHPLSSISTTAMPFQAGAPTIFIIIPLIVWKEEEGINSAWLSKAHRAKALLSISGSSSLLSLLSSSQNEMDEKMVFCIFNIKEKTEKLQILID